MAKFSVDTDMVEKLASIVSDKDLAEIKITSGDDSIRVTRTLAGETIVASSPAVAAAPVAPTPSVSAPTASAPAPVENASDDLESHPGAVKSPMVGTAYLSPQPGAAAFVSEGDTVTEGQTLLIVEAMKVMNQIPAPKGGTVKKVVVQDSSPIEYGEVLIIIE